MAEYDLVGIGNALVDVLAPVDDLFLEARDKEGLCALHRAVVKDKNISVFNEIANIFTKDTNGKCCF